jgi:hypothetical protein
MIIFNQLARRLLCGRADFLIKRIICTIFLSSRKCITHEMPITRIHLFMIRVVPMEVDKTSHRDRLYQGMSLFGLAIKSLELLIFQ